MARPKRLRLPTPTFTRRELECLRLICQGLTTEQAAEAMDCAVATAAQHRRFLRTKTGARNREQLLAWARENGYWHKADTP